MVFRYSFMVIFFVVGIELSTEHLFRTYLSNCQKHNSCVVDINKCPPLLQHKTVLISRLLAPYFKKNFCGYYNKYNISINFDIANRISKQVFRNDRRISELVDHKNFRLLPLDICGRISSRFRITSGADTSPGEFPWMALIAYKIGEAFKDEDFKCAGTLINDKFILTAAHCVNNSTMLGIRLGEYNIMTIVDCNANEQNCQPPIQDLLIEKTIVHSEYDSTDFSNDIALIQLATSANFSYNNIGPICLPFGELLHISLAGQELTVAGWGATEDGDKSSVLRKVAVPVMSLDHCQKLYQGFKPISDRQICAGADNGRDSCAGDSGGPLKRVDLINESPRYVQYGIVSFGPTHCGINSRPGIYTDVRKYMKWILDNLNQSN